MNDYRITAKRENGTELVDTFTATTEAEARKDFKEVYRHSGKLTDITWELVKEGTTASKAQEREALNKIKAIVANLGENSYLSTAFAGCFGIAEWNIENDGADSLQERLEMAEKKIAQGVEELQQTKRDYLVAFDKNRILETKNDDLLKQITEIHEQNKTRSLPEQIVEKQANEIINLKAKLYDLMTSAEPETNTEKSDCGTHMNQEDYERLEKLNDTEHYSDETAKSFIHDECGFDPKFIRIINEVSTYLVDTKTRRIIKDQSYIREPVYNSTDWNYVRFDCAGWQYEFINGNLRFYVN